MQEFHCVLLLMVPHATEGAVVADTMEYEITAVAMLEPVRSESRLVNVPCDEVGGVVAPASELSALPSTLNITSLLVDSAVPIAQVGVVLVLFPVPDLSKLELLRPVT